jgi:hypothetical protein
VIKPQDLQQLAEDAFELRLGSIQLHRGGDGKHESSSGAGYLRQLPSGELSLVAFITQAPPGWEVVWNESKKSGELFTDDDYWRIKAHDFSGRCWTASRARLHFRLTHGDKDSLWMAEATLGEVQSAESLSGTLPGSRLDLWYRGDLVFPFNTAIKKLESTKERTISESWAIAAAEFQWQALEFFVRQEGSFLVMSIGSKEDRLPANLEYRIHESLELTLARRLVWTGVVKREGHQLQSRLTGAPKNELRGRMQLPVPFTQGLRAECEAALDLFQKYLTRIATHHGDTRPDLTVAVRSAHESAGSPIDTHALDLVVAVEAVLASEFPALGQPTDGFRADLDLTKQAVMKLEIDATSRKRILGSLAAMESRSAKAKLFELAGQGVIAPSEIDAWDTIRHRAAHGTVLKGVDQDYINAFWSVLTLFYRLIFARVGYTGLYCNYGELGWPWCNLKEGMEP